MKKLLGGLLVLGSISSFASDLSGELSEFERGYNEGKNSCLDTSVICTVSVKKYYYSESAKYTGSGFSKSEALENAINNCKASIDTHAGRSTGDIDDIKGCYTSLETSDGAQYGLDLTKIECK